MENHKDLVQGLLNYIDMQGSGALLVTGVWGCGKTYFFKEQFFPFLEQERERKSVLVSLYGMNDLSDLPKRIISEYLDKVGEGKNVKLGKFAEWGGKIAEAIPKVNDWIDVSKIMGGTSHLLYKLIPNDTVIFFDDLERAVASIDINDILGAINDLVENKKYKVVVIANKGYIDEIESNERKVFYEKVIEKSLAFIPDIVAVHKLLVEGYKNEKFSKFMLADDVINVINPINAKTGTQRTLMQNIRTLKFAISHMNVLVNAYIGKGINIEDEQVRKYLYNQWLFIYGLSIELKQDKLSLENNQGLSSFGEVANYDIDFGIDDEPDALFDEQEEVDLPKVEPDFSSKFYHKYYSAESDHYIFYPQLYDFVIGGINFNIDDLYSYTESQMAKFDYKGNPAQEKLDKFLKGFWNFSDEEAKEGLLEMLAAVGEGALSNLASYYNASVYILRFANVIGKTEDEILEVFNVGIQKFVSGLEITYIVKSTFEMLPIQRGSICDKVYDMLEKAINDKLAQQDNDCKKELIELFNTNIENFVHQLILNNRVTPAYADQPILNVIDRDTIFNRVRNMQPFDFTNLDTMVRQRSRTLGPSMQEEIQFYQDLKEAVSTRKGENSISGFVITDMLLKHLEIIVPTKQEAEEVPLPPEEEAKE